MLGAAAAAWREKELARLPVAEAARLERYVSAARPKLGEADHDKWREGQALTPERAIAYGVQLGERA